MILVELKSSNNSLSPSLPSSPKGGSLNRSSVAFRPHSLTTSPQTNNELSNGFKLSSANNHLSPNYHKRATNNCSSLTNNTTSPVKYITSNGVSPGLRNSFKNILGKDGSPNAYRKPIGTPPTPNSSRNSPNLPPITSSAASSRHCSPLAFTFSSESRDSTSFKNSYSNQDGFSLHDEDSNSSVFSSSNDGSVALSNINCKSSEVNNTNSSKTKRGRKRKIESESDSLRENLNSIFNSGGRRLQSTQELVQKFNIELNSNILGKGDKPYNSLSASSSPSVFLTKEDIRKSKKRKNGTHYQNGFHHDEFSNDSVSLRNKSLPTSPALLAKRKSISPLAPSNHISPNSYQDEEDEYEEEEQYKSDDADRLNEEHHSRASYLDSPDLKPSRLFPSTIDIDKEISEIYSKLPKIPDEDIEYMKQFSFADEDEPVEDLTDCRTEENAARVASSVTPCDDDEEGDEDYEVFEYDEPYETEVDTETEVTDSEQSESEDDGESRDDDSVMEVEQNSLSDTNNCDTTTENLTAGDSQEEEAPPKQCKSLETNELEANDQQQSTDNVDVKKDLTAAANCQPDSAISDDTVASHDEVDSSSSNEVAQPNNPDSSTPEAEQCADIEMLDSNNNQSVESTAAADTAAKNAKPKKTKVITKRVKRIKFRKRKVKSNVKRTLVDRIESDQWEFVNGTYDKDGVWHDFGEMTSSLVLSSNNENAENGSPLDDNVLHILPYVNYTW